MATVKNYDPDQISISVVGIPILGGFADGTFVTVVQDADDFTDKVGAVGDVTRTKTMNRMVTITLRLMQSSDANAALSALNTLDKLAANGAGVGPTQVSDLSGTSLAFCSKSWIAKPPDMAFAQEDTPREWKIRGYLDFRVDGGN